MVADSSSDSHLTPSQRRTTAIVEEFLESHHLDFERVDTRTFMVTLPGSTKLQTHCALTIGDHSLGVSAFVIRRPDENQAAVHEWMLKKNASMYAVAFALNELGDIYLVGRLPHAAISDSELDKVVGATLQYADGAFNPLLELGFSNAIRREWAWRVERGESLANLKAFEHLIS